MVSRHGQVRHQERLVALVAQPVPAGLEHDVVLPAEVVGPTEPGRRERLDREELVVAEIADQIGAALELPDGRLEERGVVALVAQQTGQAGGGQAGRLRLGELGVQGRHVAAVRRGQGLRGVRDDRVRVLGDQAALGQVGQERGRVAIRVAERGGLGAHRLHGDQHHVAGLLLGGRAGPSGAADELGRRQRRALGRGALGLEQTRAELESDVEGTVAGERPAPGEARDRRRHHQDESGGHGQQRETAPTAGGDHGAALADRTHPRQPPAAGREPAVAQPVHQRRPDDRVRGHDDQQPDARRRGLAGGDVARRLRVLQRHPQTTGVQDRTALAVVAVRDDGEQQVRRHAHLSDGEQHDPRPAGPQQRERHHPEQGEPEMGEDVGAELAEGGESGRRRVLGGDAQPAQGQVEQRSRYEQRREVEPVRAGQKRYGRRTKSRAEATRGDGGSATR